MRLHIYGIMLCLRVRHEVLDHDSWIHGCGEIDKEEGKGKRLPT